MKKEVKRIKAPEREANIVLGFSKGPPFFFFNYNDLDEGGQKQKEQIAGRNWRYSSTRRNSYF